MVQTLNCRMNKKLIFRPMSFKNKKNNGLIFFAISMWTILHKQVFCINLILIIYFI